MGNRRYTDRASGTLGSGATNGTTRKNRGCRGLTVVVVTTANSGTSPTLTVKLQGQANDGTWYDVVGAATAAISTSTTTQLNVYPGLAASANATVNQVLPETYRLVYTVGGSSTPTMTFASSVTEHV